MITTKKIFIIFLLFIVITSSVFSEKLIQEKKQGWPAYLFTVFSGFGTGHFYLEDDAAVPFLIADIVGLGLEIGSLVYVLNTVPYTPITIRPQDELWDDVLLGVIISLTGSGIS